MPLCFLWSHLSWRDSLPSRPQVCLVPACGVARGMGDVGWVESSFKRPNTCVTAVCLPREDVGPQHFFTVLQEAPLFLSAWLHSTQGSSGMLSHFWKPPFPVRWSLAWNWSTCRQQHPKVDCHLLGGSSLSETALDALVHCKNDSTLKAHGLKAANINGAKLQGTLAPSALLYQSTKRHKTSQELLMLSLPLFIQRSQTNCLYCCSQLSAM